MQQKRENALSLRLIMTKTVILRVLGDREYFLIKLVEKSDINTWALGLLTSAAVIALK